MPFLSLALALATSAAAPPQDEARLEQLFQPPRPIATTGYGVHLSSWGTWLAVFSSAEGNPRGCGARPSGAGHLYRWNGERWAFAHSIWSPFTAAGPGNSPGISFGVGVAFAGSSLFVSDPTQSTAGFLRGAVHRYELVGDRWQWR